MSLCTFKFGPSSLPDGTNYIAKHNYLLLSSRDLSMVLTIGYVKRSKWKGIVWNQLSIGEERVTELTFKNSDLSSQAKFEIPPQNASN